MIGPDGQLNVSEAVDPEHLGVQPARVDLWFQGLDPRQGFDLHRWTECSELHSAGQERRSRSEHVAPVEGVRAAREDHLRRRDLHRLHRSAQPRPRLGQHPVVRPRQDRALPGSNRHGSPVCPHEPSWSPGSRERSRLAHSERTSRR